MLFIAILPANASEIESIHVTFTEPRYEVNAEMILDAPEAAVFGVLTDYEGLSRLDGQIRDSEVLERPEPGMAVVLVRLRGCLAFLCKTLDKVQRIRQEPGRLTARVIADRSDFNHAFEEWVLDEGDGGKTRLSYRLEMELKEPPPRIFRNTIMKRKLRGTTLNIVDNLERLARERAKL